jgi:hypothetical protein
MEAVPPWRAFVGWIAGEELAPGDEALPARRLIQQRALSTNARKINDVGAPAPHASSPWRRGHGRAGGAHGRHKPL